VVGSSTFFHSGISQYTVRLANALAQRYDVSAVLMRRLLPRRLYPGRDRVGAPVTTLRMAPAVTVFDGVDYFWVPSMLRAIAFLRRERPAVLVLQWWTVTVLHTYLALVALARLAGVTVVLEYHEVLDTAEAAHRLARLYADAGMKLLVRASGGYVVHSEFDRAAIARQFGLPDDKPVACVPHGPYDDRVTLRAEEPPRGNENEFTFLFFGTIRPYKGLEHLIRAFDSLSEEEVAGCRLVVMGETWEGWTLPADLIGAARHRGRISFVNRYVTDDEAADAFAGSDAVVLPYLRSSASGPLHLAMSYGLPVAVSAVGGLVEAASDYEGVRFVRPADVEDLQAALRELRARGRARYRDPHTWARTADSYAELFARLAVPVRSATASGPERVIR
jgi:glycosyltransferase involved in cell wall biosynthesis